MVNAEYCKRIAREHLLARCTCGSALFYTQTSIDRSSAHFACPLPDSPDSPDTTRARVVGRAVRCGAAGFVAVRVVAPERGLTRILHMRRVCFAHRAPHAKRPVDIHLWHGSSRFYETPTVNFVARSTRHTFCCPDDCPRPWNRRQTRKRFMCVNASLKRRFSGALRNVV